MRKAIFISGILLLIQTCLCQDLTKLFEKINADFVKFNHVGAQIAWDSSLDPGNTNLPDRAANYQKRREEWQQNICDKLVTLHGKHVLNETQKRQTYLLCRGPRFTFKEARDTSQLYKELQSTYSDAQICFPTIETTSKSNSRAIEDAILKYLTSVKRVTLNQSNDSIEIAAKLAARDHEQTEKDLLCLNGEEEVDKLMKFSSNEEVLKFLWLAWRERVGPSMREPYRKLVEIENEAARRNGYSDIGASWRDEVEIPNLRELCHRLYEEIRPLYSMLHGVVRFHLRRRYGDVVPQFGPIPAHLLGGLWSQNWEPLAELNLPRTVNLDQSITNLNWTVQHMVKRAEDFYQSLGLPAMTDAFWRESVFTREKDDARCHGTAADMYKDGDFRLLYCSDTTMEDFYVVHHEMGHIQYYMSYEHQPGIFRQANSFLHESIGDTIMLGAMTPQHLHRLGLINDSLLYEQGSYDYDDDNDDDDDDETAAKFAPGGSFKDENVPTILEILLLKSALNKIPQIPFGLLIDEFRWKYFEGGIDQKTLNEDFWTMALELQGVAPPGFRGEEYFDLAAKFHVPDNTPYIRYFLSAILQYQLHERACAAAVFGHRDVTLQVPPSLHLAACDVYGSKANGRLLKDIMSRGHSQPWREILTATTGSDEISASALKRYYRPLYKLLKRMIRLYQIPIGW